MSRLVFVDGLCTTFDYQIIFATRVLISIAMKGRRSSLDEGRGVKKRRRSPLDEQCAHGSKGRPRKRRAFCIEDDFDDVALLLPCGPSSLDEIANWPEDLLLLAAKQGPAARALMLDFLRILRFTTDYSGCDGPREMMHQLYLALSRPLSYPSGGAFGTGLDRVPTCKFTRACDNAPLPLQVLQWSALNLDKGRSCVYDSIEGCLTEDTMSGLYELIPHMGKKNLTTEERAENAQGYAVVLDKLMRERDMLFGDRPHSYCCIHDRQCPCDAVSLEGDDDLFPRL